MRSHIRITALLACVATGFVACDGSSGAGGDWAGSMRDSAGVTVVTNPAMGLWTDEDRWTITEELRIGTTGGDPNYQFGQISGIAELSDGRIAVFDNQAQHLRIFSSEGEYVSTIGGAGSGPGEFGIGAGPVLIGPGDSIYVPDFANQRVNKFTAQAQPVGSVPMNLTGGIPIAWLDTPEGDLIKQIRPMTLPGQAAVTDPKDLVLRLGSDLAVRDTLLTFTSGESFSFGDGGMPSFKFFSPEVIWSTTSDGKMVSGYNDDFKLSVYEGGELRRIIVKPFEIREVADGDEAVLLEGMTSFFADLGIPPQAMPILRERMEFGETYPAYVLIRGGPEGSIWVQQLRTLSELTDQDMESFNPILDMGAPVWDVFDPEGRYMGELRLPDRYQPIRVNEDRIYGIWRDELDVQYVLILRVNWESEELESGAS